MNTVADPQTCTTAFIKSSKKWLLTLSADLCFLTENGPYIGEPVMAVPLCGIHSGSRSLSPGIRDYESLRTTAGSLPRRERRFSPCWLEFDPEMRLHYSYVSDNKSKEA